MDMKKFWKETFGGFVLKNVLIATAIVVALSWISLIVVDFYTHHGESEIVPDLRGSYLEEAELVLAKQGLYPQVIDSVFVRDKKLGTIIEQIPAPNSNVKSNRPIYLIINSRFVRQVSLPDVSDVSFRQASAMLQSIGLTVGSVEYAPSEYKDLVTEVKYQGRHILPGARIPEGCAVVLVVGNGLGNAMIEVPAMKGMSLEEATQAALSAFLVIGAVEYDVAPSGDEADYFIYRQRPASGSSLSSGSRLDVYLTKDKARLNEIFEEDKNPTKNDKKTAEGDEEFF
jgi:beta-lactam-binding protein with PASTA domain